VADSVENWDHEASYKSRTVLSTIEAQRINHRDTPSPSPSNPRIQELWSKTIRKRTSSVFSTADHPRSQASSRIYVVGADTSNAVDTISHRFDELEKGRCTPQLEHPQLEHCPLQLGHDEQEQPPGHVDFWSHTLSSRMGLDLLDVEEVSAKSLLVRVLRGGRKQVFGPACLCLAKRPTYPSLYTPL